MTGLALLAGSVVGSGPAAADETGTGSSSVAATPVAGALLPFASAPAPLVTGTARVGSLLRAVPGTWSPSAALTYQWSVGGRDVAGATHTSYVPAVADQGKRVTVRVTATLSGYTTTVRTSAATAAVAAGVFTVAPAPALSGAVRVGSLVRAVAGSWSPGATVGYQWRRDGLAIRGATLWAYRPVRADQGHRLSVTVTGRRNGYAALSRTSAATTVGAGEFTPAPVPVITGAPRLGATLTARPGTWRPAAVLTYRWYRDGVRIAGATRSTYRVTTADFLRHLTVRTTAVRFGYRTTRRTSAPTPLITRPFASTAVPTIRGTLRVGSTLTAAVRAWSPRARFSYQWLRNGAAIPGATGARYRLTGSDYHQRVAVRVTGRRTSYFPTRRYSAATGRIAAPAPVLTRNGVYRVGVDVKPGTYVSRGGDFCYWERRRSAGDSFDGIIANDLGDGQRIVRIEPTDRYFDTQRCGGWTRLVALGPARSSFGDGVFAVGTQVRPGLYATTGSPDYCYWARLAGFTASSDDLIDNDVAEGRQYVRLHSGDVGVESAGCGTWKRVSN